MISSFIIIFTTYLEMKEVIKDKMEQLAMNFKSSEFKVIVKKVIFCWKLRPNNANINNYYCSRLSHATKEIFCNKYLVVIKTDGEKFSNLVFRGSIKRRKRIKENEKI